MDVVSDSGEEDIRIQANGLADFAGPVSARIIHGFISWTENDADKNTQLQ